jgi:phage tail tape-measure protein
MGNRGAGHNRSAVPPAAAQPFATGESRGFGAYGLSYVGADRGDHDRERSGRRVDRPPTSAGSCILPYGANDARVGEGFGDGG